MKVFIVVICFLEIFTNSARLRANSFEKGGGFEAGPARSELAEEIVTNQRRRPAKRFGGKMGGIGVEELRN